MESLFNQIVEPFYPNELTQEELERNLPGYDLSEPFMVLHKKDGDMIIQDVRRLSYDDGHIYLLGSKDDGMYKIEEPRAQESNEDARCPNAVWVSLIHSLSQTIWCLQNQSYIVSLGIPSEWRMVQFEDEQVEYVKTYWDLSDAM